MHNFLKKIEKLKLSEGQFHHFDIKHDEWCNLLKGTGECNCDPDVNVLFSLDVASSDAEVNEAAKKLLDRRQRGVQ